MGYDDDDDVPRDEPRRRRGGEAVRMWEEVGATTGQ